MLQRVDETKPWRKPPRTMFSFRCNKHGIKFKFTSTMFPGWRYSHKVYRCPVCVAEAKSNIERAQKIYRLTGTPGACKSTPIWFGLTKAGEKRR